MKNNMSRMDRIIRFILVIAIIILLYAEVIKGTLATIIGILAMLFVVTSVLGWCPTYSLLKISIKKKDTIKPDKDA